MSNNPSVYGRYKEHFACFKCRKMFKQTAWDDLPEAVRQQYKTYLEYRQNYKASCPQCGQAMPNMGKGFKPPKQNGVRLWLAYEQQAARGISFSGWRW